MCSVRQMTDENAQGVVPAPKSRTRLVAAIAVAVALVLAIGGVAFYGATASSGITVTGSLELTHRSGLDGFCAASMVGFSDIQAGAQIVITDGAGKTLAIGHLSEGGRVAPTVCAYRFVIDDVPDGEDFYAIEVAHRGKVQYSRADLDKPIRLTVG